MIASLTRRERIAVVFWLVLAIVVWNALYDLLLARSTQEYLFQQALYLAGRGPGLELAQAMDLAVRDAIWISTLWACIMLLAGLLTLRIPREPASR
jgi:hypothetical protein